MNREQSVPYQSAAWLSIINNILLALFKGGVGLLFDSQALLANALYSATDAATGVTEKMQIPGRWKRRISDGAIFRIETKEPLIAILFSILLLLGGLQMAISSAIVISKGEIAPPGYMAGVAIVISIALKELVFQYRYRQDRKNNTEGSRSYIEMHRYSVYTSVIVLVGVFGSMTGQALQLSAMLYFDPIAAFCVSLLVLWRGYGIVRAFVYGPIISQLQEEDASDFIETVQRVHGVIMVNDIKAQENGHYVSVVARISVNPRISVSEANDIANRAKVLLLHRFSHVGNVSIQVLPYDPGYPYKSNHSESDSDLPTLLQ
ncbi:cation diffusion facilitator family transporter [Paenibacillus anaericanus]|uniref:Cation diffusion facilitator family transporter n=1 Tax=Paenibacillus anaericanus TaxID=170367 RepID=A0A3S1DEW5_9BACL|nr:cation diffusion facilitator family transporter [Paenibacillus anaericanus]RUT43309.1 cation diffusion facilitator family transporter [Paenibacillus anaericanus]